MNFKRIMFLFLVMISFLTGCCLSNQQVGQSVLEDEMIERRSYGFNKLSNSSSYLDYLDFEFDLKEMSYSVCKCYDTYYIDHITIPSTYNGFPVTKIGNEAFEDCYQLETIEIPNSIIEIGDYAFANCIELRKIEFPSSVKKIGDHAFENCNSLNRIEIPSGVRSIGDYAFSRCYSLEGVVIENGLEEIGDNAFYGCDSLTNINIPSSVNEIGSDAFDFCNRVHVIFESDYDRSMVYYWGLSYWNTYSEVNYVKLDSFKYLDIFPLLFVGIALVGTIFAIVALFVGKKAKNSYRNLVIILFVFTLILFCGAVVTGSIGCIVYYPKHDTISWICLGVGSGAGLFGILAFIIQLITKNIKPKVKRIINKDGIIIESDNNENYVESRFGSIELFDDYFVLSTNFVRFTSARRKRAVIRIYYDQIANAMFRPAGWFKGHIWLWSKSCVRQKPDTVIPFKLWMPGSSKMNSKEYEEIYNKIVDKIHENKKQLKNNANKTILY